MSAAAQAAVMPPDPITSGASISAGVQFTASVPDSPAAPGTAASTPTSGKSFKKLLSGKSFLKRVKHKGHRNLGIRGMVAFVQALLTLVMFLVVGPGNYPMGLPVCLCQLWSASTLTYQCKTGNPNMFWLRSIPSFLRCLCTLFMVACGRQIPFAEECNSQAWHDERMPFRIIHCFASVRFFMNGCSLLLQFKFPWAGVGVFGNQQLFYRGCVQATGVPINLLRGMMKMGELSGTPYERQPVEVVVNLLRCFVLIPIASWSLLDQWTSTGKGQKTDDNRTTKANGRVLGNAAEHLGHLVSPHAGHRNLLIRGVIASYQGVMTVFMIGYGIDIPHKLPTAACQFFASTTLIIQWRTGNPRMFVFRAVPSFVRAAILCHQAVCGRRWPGDECVDEAWSDVRLPFRVLHVFATLRLFLNGCSLVCQYKFAHRMFRGHGNEQLFYRGCVQAAGIPLNLLRVIFKLTLLRGTEFERDSLEVAVNLIRAMVLIPIASWSLFNQWLNTGAGNTGHVRTDKHEVLRRMKSLEPSRSRHGSVSISSLGSLGFGRSTTKDMQRKDSPAVDAVGSMGSLPEILEAGDPDNPQDGLEADQEADYEDPGRARSPEVAGPQEPEASARPSPAAAPLRIPAPRTAQNMEPPGDVEIHEDAMNRLELVIAEWDDLGSEAPADTWTAAPGREAPERPQIDAGDDSLCSL